MSEPEWVHPSVVTAIHADQLARYGGTPGVRDAGALESALLRPRNAWMYEGVNDVPALAARYLVALARGHAFIDGNKRTAFVTALLFCECNGVIVQGDEAGAVDFAVRAATGDAAVAEIATWLRDHGRPH
ncbi:MAG: type II toxin-antitoxin system death-on-curing family toxin [Candidatus Nanopelagicales bacterium]|nr:type II toxin-antitoxin system death-on-curing family toxin [Candidatus Nanopelagicales bacterium]MDZ4249225.1 type II toxin-antitoxin system death-on-curing family toxin [Candidatus Nanopelagicales bacterium]MDZ7577708.1 type II toxin-antitoxin system death-on-curing family toxin [Candidatus Nanopelagicales bacterium]